MIFIIFLWYTPIIRSQSVDSVIHIATVVSSEYTDALRQRSDKYNTTIFARSFDVKVSASRGNDTLTILYSGWNQYISYNNYTWSISSALDNGFRSFALKWISSIGWFNYSGTLLFPLSHYSEPFYYGGRIRLYPIGSALTGAIEYERMPLVYSSGLGLKDFMVPLNQSGPIIEWKATLQSQPVKFLEGIFSCGESITKSDIKMEEYSLPLDWCTRTLAAQVSLHLAAQSSFWIGWSEKEGNGNVLLTKDGLMFGDLAKGTLIYDIWRLGGMMMVYSLPLTCEYNYHQWELHGVGHLESWPFTPLASTVFSNRLYYALDGKFDLHQLKSSTAITLGGWHVEPALSVLYLLSDGSIKHWEPGFLVFGVKNADEEPFSIERCWLLQLGCQFIFPLFDWKAAVQVEQLIPISVRYHEEQISPGAPSVPSKPSVSTDGGRRIQLTIFIP
jgi:hypothetical protein